MADLGKSGSWRAGENESLIRVCSREHGMRTGSAARDNLSRSFALKGGRETQSLEGDVKSRVYVYSSA